MLFTMLCHSGDTQSCIKGATKAQLEAEVAMRDGAEAGALGAVCLQII